MPTDKIAIKKISSWLQKVVIGLNLCPFAGKPFADDQIRFSVSHSKNLHDLLSDLYFEMNFLEKHAEVETTLLILLDQCSDFEQFNDSLEDVDQLIDNAGYSGVFQVASFHPNYIFADTDTDPDELSNWSNRSPFPVLHILREDSIQNALENYPNADAIPEKNIEKLNKMSESKLTKLFDLKQ